MIYPCVCPSVHPSMYPSMIHPYIYASILPSIHTINIYWRETVRSHRSAGGPGSVIFRCFTTKLGSPSSSVHLHNFMFWKILSERQYSWSSSEFASYFLLVIHSYNYHSEPLNIKRSLAQSKETWCPIITLEGLRVQSRDYKMTALGLHSGPDVYFWVQIIVFKNGIILHKFQLYS